MRTAAYARFSSDLQRETSLDDHIRTGREFAERHGWIPALLQRLIRDDAHATRPGRCV